VGRGQPGSYPRITGRGTFFFLFFLVSFGFFFIVLEQMLAGAYSVFFPVNSSFFPVILSFFRLFRHNKTRQNNRNVGRNGEAHSIETTA
jgi:hypothetical protein